MPKYEVTVTRTDYAVTDFIINAPSADAATTLAYLKAGDHEFGSGNAEYEVEDVELISEEETPESKFPSSVLTSLSESIEALRRYGKEKLLEGRSEGEVRIENKLIDAIEAFLHKHGICAMCGQHFAVHNDDGSCVED